MDFPKNLHHAYIIEGDRKSSREELFKFLKNSFEMKPGNPDLFLFSSENFTIEDSRALAEANLRKPMSVHGPSVGKKFIVSEFSSISVQAQNSLLKTLEEPWPGTYFFLLTETASIFLPTVLSRVHILSHSNKSQAGNFDHSAAAKKFLSSKPAERIEMIKKLMAEKEDGKIQDSDIEKFVAEAESLANNSSKNKKELKPLVVVDEYLRDTSSSSKMLLEYLAMALPVFSI